jgi:dienelactone hydrolase
MLLPFFQRGLPLLMVAISTATLFAAPADDVPPSYFHPPAESAEKFASLRSPFKFDDGTTVTSAQDWPRRRQEILYRWHAIMGAWPALVEHPRIETLSSEPREHFTQRKIRVEIAAGRMADGYLLIPDGKGKFPAVFVPYYEPETSVGLGKENRDFARQLANRGFVTLAIGSPGGDARKPVLGEATCQPLSFLGYVGANCANALADLPEVDPARIGVVGHSYGGKWAMFASCLYDRFACAAWSDPGVVFDETNPSVNYWDPWYLGVQPGDPRPLGLPDERHPRTGAYRALVEAGLDLTDLHALMAPRPFLVSGGAVDPPSRWPTLNFAVAVNHLLGFENRVGLTARPAHDPTPESNGQICQFFAHWLQGGAP